jgi:AbrB family looped-hinge helix DNA binding protein
VRITDKGQVTIPVEIREKLGLMPGTEVDFVVEGDQVRLVRSSQPRKETRGQEAVRLLSGSATRKLGMSTDEIMKLLRGE